jgi:hypothetical protein
MIYVSVVSMERMNNLNFIVVVTSDSCVTTISICYYDPADAVNSLTRPLLL